jgi:DNA-binding NarL/FixJ family response regulator
MNPPEKPKIRIFIVDDSSIVRRGIAAFLHEDQASPRIEVVGEAGTVAEAIVGIRALRPDLALIDVRLPDGLGITVCQAIEEEKLGVHSLVITSYPNDEYVRDAISAGALGYILKDVDPAALLAAVRLCATGQSALDQDTINRVVRFIQAESRQSPALTENLSAQERRVLELVADGRTNSEAAKILGLSPHTVKNHLANIFQKLGVGNRAGAVAFLLRSENEA